MKKQNNEPKDALTKRRGKLGDIAHRFFQNRGAAIGLIIVVILILTAVTCPLFLDYRADVTQNNISQRLQPPSAAHLFGTDDLGRDIFSRVVWGARYSLSIGISSMFVSLIIGVFLGSLAGYYTQTAVEMVIMRLCDILSAIPSILLGMVIVAVFGRSAVNIVIACSIMGISPFLRITRASVMAVAGQEFVESARAIGTRDFGIIFGHVLPNALSPIIVEATLDIAGMILSVSSLSFLGLGIPAPAPEWGGMLSGARQYITTKPYLTLPGFAILLTVLSFNLMGDGLRDALDPKQKK